MEPTETDLPDHVLRNRVQWDKNAAEYVKPGERAWARQEPTWGIWGVPESELHVFPDNLAGKDTIELGCGTAYVSAWLRRRGARVVGIDNSAVQLQTARRLQHEYDLEMTLIHGNAERVPYPDASFDLAISEYGACLWADPYRWVPEAARLLRPGGELIFLVGSMLLVLCEQDDENQAATNQLRRPAFGLHRIEWPDTTGVEFYLTHGDWIRLLRRSGFEVEDLIEVKAPEGATTRYRFVSPEWAQQWPSEEIWKARRIAERQPDLSEATQPMSTRRTLAERKPIRYTGDRPLSEWIVEERR